jgi:hypothetical protein
MKRVLKHRLTISMATVAVCLVAGTFVSGDAYPVAMGIIWAVYAVTLGFAVVAIRRDLHHG